ncbi:diacylglycerol kinase family protein [Alkalibacterium sp. AK22]|uniref:diacylglycerol kinase family protein n=1 Tax=Alkalibacterium sp. AK22 TaxID=1229520 RepID=UPI00054D5027|nr:diacylglycerol kinase family protein [Alkalibacterium sp. AK22]
MDLNDNEEQQLPQKNRTYRDSFRFAFKGIQTAFQEERNMRVHVMTGAAVLLLGLLLPLNRTEWLWLILVSYLVFVMELINTVAENVVDLVTEEYHPIAKKVKDMAAAVVLVTALFSVIVGGIIIVPKLIQIIM